MIINDRCYLCGEHKGFEEKEGHGIQNATCTCCGATLAESDIAHMLVKYAGQGDKSLKEALHYIEEKRIFNIDFDGRLHVLLKEHPLYQKKEEGRELCDYESGCFDIVVSQNCFKGTAEVEKNIAEIDRIMAPQGVHIYVTSQDETTIGAGKSFVWRLHDFDVIATHKKMSDIAEYSGERFVPGIEDKNLAIEHTQRYMSVSRLVSGKKVLDIACGEGYGSAILADYAFEVIGIDIDEGTIKRADEKYKKDNLRYKIGNIVDIPEENNSIDVIVSFETIEHVSPKQQEQFLAECRRVLKKDGILIISTPNKEVYSDRYNYFNEYHIHEFYHDEFINFIRQQFAHVKMYNQAFQVASILSDCDNMEDSVRYYPDGKYDSNGKYYIAIASQNEICIPNISSVYMSQEGEYEQIMQRILKLQSEEQKRNIHIEKLDKEIKFDRERIIVLQNNEQERNNHIVVLDKQICLLENSNTELKNENNVLSKEKSNLEAQVDILQEKNNIIIQYRDVLSEKNELLHEKNEVLTYKNKVLNEGKEELAKKCQQLEKDNAVLVEKNDLLIQKNDFLETEVCKLNNDVQMTNYNELNQMKNEKQELIQQLRNKEGHIELLLESEREFERYKKTRAYKATLRRRKIVNAILPPNSKRLFILSVIKRTLLHPRTMLHVIRPSYIGNYIKYLKQDSIEEITSRYDELLGIAKGEPGTMQSQIQESCVTKVDDTKKLEITDYEIICFEKNDNPDVSIIIPVYNQFDYTYNCLKSILENSGNVSYEIIIANDCSTDITRDIEQVAKNVRLITTEKNVRFLLNCNNAAEYAKGKYILFLNNDTQVMENWLQPLIDVMASYADVGMVGSKLVYPDGKLQEAGGIVWKDASAWNYGHLKSPDDPEFVYLKEADYVSGAAIMIRTELWNEIGGFDTRYVPAYYEDTDLAFEVRKHGYKVMMQPKSIVIHFEGISNGTDTSVGLKAYQVENRQKFYDKWKNVLEKEHFENAQNVYLAKDRGQTKKQILVVDHYVPNYDKDAGGRCTYMYLKMFLRMGLKVTFIGDNFARPEPYTSELNALGIEILFGNNYYNNWKGWLADNLHYFDYIYLQRPHISIKYIDIVKKYARGKVFYFAHDLHHVRMYRDYLLTGDKNALEESQKWKKIEMELFTKADVGHVVGSYEQEVMQKVFPDKPIRNIPLYIYDESPDGIEKDFSKRHDILFVGGFGHTPNIDAVIWFYENVYTKVLKRYPDMVWHIVGSKAPDEVLQLAGPNVVIEGFLSDEELAEMYKKCRLSVVPLRYGAGVKGKVVESAYYQIPLVTTPIGGEGLDSAMGAFVMEEDADNMAELICSLYEDYPRLRKMSDAGIEFISTYFTSKVAEQVLLQDM